MYVRLSHFSKVYIYTYLQNKQLLNTYMHRFYMHQSADVCSAQLATTSVLCGLSLTRLLVTIRPARSLSFAVYKACTCLIGGVHRLSAHPRGSTCHAESLTSMWRCHWVLSTSKIPCMQQQNNFPVRPSANCGRHAWMICLLHVDETLLLF